MTCPYLTGINLKTCGAAPDAYRPSEFQFDEYCTSSWHTLCPLLPRNEQRAKNPGGSRRTGAGVIRISRLPLTQA